MEIENYKISLNVILKHIYLNYSLTSSFPDKDVRDIYEAEIESLKYNSFNFAIHLDDLITPLITQDFLEVRNISEAITEFITFPKYISLTGNTLNHYYRWNCKIYSLLKQENPMSTYVLYIEKSTFLVESFDRNTKLTESRHLDYNKFKDNFTDEPLNGNEIYDYCFLWYLGKIISIRDVFNFLDYQLQYFNSKEEMCLYLDELISHFKVGYKNLLSKHTLKRINKWIKDKSSNIKESSISNVKETFFSIEDEMSPNDKKNQTYPKLAIKLENAPKIHLFIFLFYYRLNIKIPPIEQIANNMFILQGKKYIDTTIFDKILSAGFYYQKSNVKEKHIKNVIEYLTSSENEELIPLFNNYVKDHFN